MTAVAKDDGQALIERIQAGEPDAFGELYARYRAPIFRFLYFRLNDRQRSEDLTHDVFVRALGSVHRFQWQGKDPGAWLVTIARNLMHDHRKSADYQRSLLVDNYEGMHSPDGSREGNPEAAVVEKLRDTALIKALWLLSADQRDCLIHRYVLGLSLAETAALMGRNESAIKALAFRATQAMARYLGEEVWR